ncbi:MAG: diacylglycerol kinase [Candidatus Uhrbacteria bacterium GW2011_GWE2_40_58]|nr:MAG: diacylglycerol kinase [Candidatus Uhrbacteria bacterium GW2011_GWF2_40_263]KKR67857.1 MAG: diacylglycerol kinase [Candidatus Uhrbacteria bacterium GW2011_GWE2_40_58]OGL92565.1 MAG: hypothetical protein A2239_04755 [Candidatus Uhrbacteria bacterium RIFOXYA2_FULL_40_9]OGL96829.1 MAG: hypothetical protein A2332_02220 [Candidatus Uhrbacteria bacterium RIFOXYB2_FULL_41_18]HBK34913.1 diacylglycerol kinase [Candidatus Uhrbacteria bacterium]
MIKVRQLFHSFSHAFRGIRLVFFTEQSFRIQLFSGCLVLLLAMVFDLVVFERIILFLLVGSVLVLELINSVFERIIDTFKPRIHPAVKDMKDMMAGAVLVSSFIAALIGVIIFLPHILSLF